MLTPGNICDHCNYKFEITKENTVIFYYECQPWFSFGSTICPKCEMGSRLFYRDNQLQYLEHFILIGLTFITDVEFAPPDVVKAFEDVYGVRPLEEHQLLPRMEKEIQALREWLQQAPDEWIETIFEESAPPKERPETWC